MCGQLKYIFVYASNNESYDLKLGDYVRNILQLLKYLIKGRIGYKSKE